MRKTIISGIMCIGMMVILTVLGLFDMPFKQWMFTGVSVVLFSVFSILLMLMNTRVKPKKLFKVYGISIGKFGIILLSLIVLVCGSFLLNFVVNAVCAALGHPIVADSLISSELADNFFVGILTVAIIPAVFEEIFFRGAVMSSIQDKGLFYAIFMSSLLFTITHGLDPYFLTTFFAGCIFSVIVLLTNSIFAAIIVHFANNIISYMLSVYAERLAEVNLDIYMLYGVILIFLLSLYGVLAYAVRNYKKSLRKERNILNEGEILWQEQGGVREEKIRKRK